MHRCGCPHASIGKGQNATKAVCRAVSQVVMPRNAAEAKGLLLASIREPDPVIFLEPKILYRTSVEDVPDNDYVVPLGVADVMREGTDVTLVRLEGTQWSLLLSLSLLLILILWL